MTVSELLRMLEDCDPEAEVRIMSQEGWPFENAVHGVVTREDLGDPNCDCGAGPGRPHDEHCCADEEPEYEDGLAGTDVFIVEGRQERYGSKDAWAVARRH